MEKFDEVVDILLNSGHMIYGSYIYKRMLLGITPKDIDVINQENYIKRVVYDTLKGFFQRSVYSAQFKIDFSFSDDLHLRAQPCFVNAVGLKMVGDQINFVPTIDSVTPEMVDYVVENIAQRKLCPWSDMRQKDIDFFKDFEELGRAECEMNGFPYETKMWKIKSRYA